jgi:hypothetical protein
VLAKAFGVSNASRRTVSNHLSPKNAATRPTSTTTIPPAMARFSDFGAFGEVMEIENSKPQLQERFFLLAIDGQLM